MNSRPLPPPSRQSAPATDAPGKSARPSARTLALCSAANGRPRQSTQNKATRMTVQAARRARPRVRRARSTVRLGRGSASSFRNTYEKILGRNAASADRQIVKLGQQRDRNDRRQEAYEPRVGGDQEGRESDGNINDEQGG